MADFAFTVLYIHHIIRLAVTTVRSLSIFRWIERRTFRVACLTHF